MKKTWVKIPEILFFQEGPGVRNTQYTKEGVKLLNVSNLVNGKIDLSTSDRYISEEEATGKYKHFLCNDGDFIVASSGIKVEYIDKKMGFVDKTMLPLCMNTSTIRFKVIDESRLKIRYFMYFLKSRNFKNQLFRQITGSAQLNYGPSHLKKMDVPLIDIKSQEKIVDRLDKIQNIIELYQQQIEKYDDLIKARFVELFGLPVSNSRGWKTEQMGDVAPAVNYRGKFDDKVWLLNLDMVEAQTGKVLDYLIVPNDEVGNSTCTFDTSNVLYSKLRPYLNKVVIPDRCGYATSELVPLKPVKDKINREYLAFMLRSDEFVSMINEKVAGAKMPRVSMGDFRKFDVPIPPLELQNQFADFVKQVDKSKFAVQQALDKAQLLFDSLMQEYFG